MRSDREDIYRELEDQVGNTAIEEFTREVPNRNRILIKRECDNPYGSHYDRVYLRLFRQHEEQGDIKPGQPMLETTSGSAGVSFAGIGKKLGYNCYVAIPAGGEKARENAILEHLPANENLIFTPAEPYIAGFPRFLREFLPRHLDFFFMNHSMGKKDDDKLLAGNNEFTLSALESIAKEVLGEFVPDYYVPAIGNGSSVLGPGRILRPETTVVGFEPFQSAVAYDLKYPGRYEQEFKIAPGTLKRHRLPGASYPGLDLPHLRNAVTSGLLSNVILVSDRQTRSEYRGLMRKPLPTEIPDWDNAKNEWSDLGRTGLAGLSVCLKLARVVIEKKIVMIAYDKAERYDLD